MSEEYLEAEWSDVPVVPMDHQALHEGFRYFWSNNQITGFKRDKNGNYVRDEDGNLIAYRTSKPRVMHTGWFNFKNESNYIDE